MNSTKRGCSGWISAKHALDPAPANNRSFCRLLILIHRIFWAWGWQYMRHHWLGLYRRYSPVINTNLLDMCQESSQFYLNQKTRQISVAWNHKKMQENSQNQKVEWDINNITKNQTNLNHPHITVFHEKCWIVKELRNGRKDTRKEKITLIQINLIISSRAPLS